MSYQWRPTPVKRATSIRPGAAFDVRQPSVAASSRYDNDDDDAVDGQGRVSMPVRSNAMMQPSAMNHHVVSRPLKRLDDDDESTSSHLRTSLASAALDDRDPLDAFMSSLSSPDPPQRTMTDSVVSQQSSGDIAATQQDDDIDPLDAFMMQNTPSIVSTRSRSDVVMDSSSSSSNDQSSSSAMQYRLSLDNDDDDDDDENDEMYSADASRSIRKRRREYDDDDDDVNDEDNVAMDVDDQSSSSSSSAPASRRRGALADLSLLQPIDHSRVQYSPIRKCVYQQCDDISRMPQGEIDALCEDLDIRVTGQCPRPCFAFNQFGFTSALLRYVIDTRHFAKPTPVQAQTVPAIMSGADVIAMARTGSGKTLAFVWPLLMHLLPSASSSSAASSFSSSSFRLPRVLILAPTRELADQIFLEVSRHCSLHSLRAVLLVGGAQKYAQKQELRRGCEAVVATPGRLADLVVSRDIDCSCITFVVLDEADRLLALGFSDQLAAILGQIRPDRQLVLFSATINPAVERLAQRHMRDPTIRVNIGSGGANDAVQQSVHLVRGPEAKVQWMQNNLDSLAQGPLLVFVSTILGCEELTKRLKKGIAGTAHANGRSNHHHHPSRDIPGSHSSSSALVPPSFDIVCLHGDLSPTDRISVFARFKSGAARVLVATDVAARGLDIPSLPCVVCFDVARTVESHTHRIGRTGRAGAVGRAITIVDETSNQDKRHLAIVVESMHGAGQEVSEQVQSLIKGGGQSASRGRGGGYSAGRGGGSSGADSSRGGRASANNSHQPTSYNAAPPPPPASSFRASTSQPSHSLSSALLHAHAAAVSATASRMSAHAACGLPAPPPYASPSSSSSSSYPSHPDHIAYQHNNNHNDQRQHQHHPLPPPPPSVAATHNTSMPMSSSSIHPSRMAQVPGANNHHQAAASSSSSSYAPVRSTAMASAYDQQSSSSSSSHNHAHVPSYASSSSSSSSSNDQSMMMASYATNGSSHASSSTNATTSNITHAKKKSRWDS